MSRSHVSIAHANKLYPVAVKDVFNRGNDVKTSFADDSGATV